MTGPIETGDIREALHDAHDDGCDLMHPSEGQISARSCDCHVAPALAALTELEQQLATSSARHRVDLAIVKEQRDLAVAAETALAEATKERDIALDELDQEKRVANERFDALAEVKEAIQDAKYVGFNRMQARAVAAETERDQALKDAADYLTHLKAAEAALAEANRDRDNIRRRWQEDVSRYAVKVGRAERRANDWETRAKHEEDQKRIAARAHLEEQGRANELADALREIADCVPNAGREESQPPFIARAALDRHTQETT